MPTPWGWETPLGGVDPLLGWQAPRGGVGCPPLGGGDSPWGVDPPLGWKAPRGGVGCPPLGGGRLPLGGLTHPWGWKAPRGGVGCPPHKVEGFPWGSMISPSPMRFQKTPPVESGMVFPGGERLSRWGVDCMNMGWNGCWNVELGVDDEYEV